MERDPLGIQPHAPGAKLDAGKPRASLLKQFGLALLEVAKVSTYGANKYTPGGWQHVTNGIERYDDALWRHILQEHLEPIDESGMLTAAQEAWNALARLELMLRAKHESTKIKCTKKRTTKKSRMARVCSHR